MLFVYSMSSPLDSFLTHSSLRIPLSMRLQGQVEAPCYILSRLLWFGADLGEGTFIFVVTFLTSV